MSEFSEEGKECVRQALLDIQKTYMRQLYRLRDSMAQRYSKHDEGAREFSQAVVDEVDRVLAIMGPRQ